MVATGLDYEWYFDRPYKKYYFSEIATVIDKIIQALDGYAKISSISFFKGERSGPKIELDCNKTDYQKCLEKIADYFEKKHIKKINEGKRTAHEILIIADAQLAHEKNGKLIYSFKEHFLELILRIVSGKESREGLHLVLRPKNPIFMEIPKVFEVNSIKFNKVLKKLKNAIGDEADIYFDAGDQQELWHLADKGVINDSIADVNGFKPEKKHMIDFKTVKKMIKQFNYVLKIEGDNPI